MSSLAFAMHSIHDRLSHIESCLEEDKTRIDASHGGVRSKRDEQAGAGSLGLPEKHSSDSKRDDADIPSHSTHLDRRDHSYEQDLHQDPVQAEKPSKSQNGFVYASDATDAEGNGGLNLPIGRRHQQAMDSEARHLTPSTAPSRPSGRIGSALHL